MASRVKPLASGIRAVLKSEGVAAILTDRAEDVLAAAKADPHDDTYAYENGLRVETYIGRNRARARVISGDHKGHILEANYGILARALDAAGGRRA